MIKKGTAITMILSTLTVIVLIFYFAGMKDVDYFRFIVGGMCIITAIAYCVDGKDVLLTNLPANYFGTGVLPGFKPVFFTVCVWFFLGFSFFPKFHIF